MERDARRMYTVLVGLAAACALLLALVFERTAPIIARNKAQALERALFRVLPAATRYQALRWTDRFEAATDPAQAVAFAAYGEDDRLVGFAVPARGPGYQDTIVLLYGYDPRRQAIIGMTILDSRETPGLGDRVGFDAGFLRNFVQLDAALGADGATLLHAIESVPAGKKTQPWQIDSLSGATVSSRAVAAIIRASAALWVPRLYREQELGHGN
jgi:electron transport complex protein RnfG